MILVLNIMRNQQLFFNNQIIQKHTSQILISHINQEISSKTKK
jgi:hypothetical protein